MSADDTPPPAAVGGRDAERCETKQRTEAQARHADTLSPGFHRAASSTDNRMQQRSERKLSGWNRARPPCVRKAPPSAPGNMSSSRGTVPFGRGTVPSARGTMPSARGNMSSARGTAPSARGTPLRGRGAPAFACGPAPVVGTGAASAPPGPGAPFHSSSKPLSKRAAKRRNKARKLEMKARDWPSGDQRRPPAGPDWTVQRPPAGPDRTVQRQQSGDCADWDSDRLPRASREVAGTDGAQPVLRRCSAEASGIQITYEEEQNGTTTDPSAEQDDGVEEKGRDQQLSHSQQEHASEPNEDGHQLWDPPTERGSDPARTCADESPSPEEAGQTGHHGHGVPQARGVSSWPRPSSDHAYSPVVGARPFPYHTPSLRVGAESNGGEEVGSKAMIERHLVYGKTEPDIPSELGDIKCGEDENANTLTVRDANSLVPYTVGSDSSESEEPGAGPCPLRLNRHQPPVLHAEYAAPASGDGPLSGHVSSAAGERPQAYVTEDWFQNIVKDVRPPDPAPEQPDAGDKEMDGVFFQSQEDLTQLGTVACPALEGPSLSSLANIPLPCGPAPRPAVGGVAGPLVTGGGWGRGARHNLTTWDGTVPGVRQRQHIRFRYDDEEQWPRLGERRRSVENSDGDAQATWSRPTQALLPGSPPAEPRRRSQESPALLEDRPLSFVERSRFSPSKQRPPVEAASVPGWGRGAWRPDCLPPGMTPRALQHTLPLAVYRPPPPPPPPPADRGRSGARYVPAHLRGDGGAASPSAHTDKLGPDAIATFRRRLSGCHSAPYDPAVLVTQQLPVGFIDSHCHLDYLFKRDMARGGCWSLKEYRAKVSASFPVSFAGCVAVFCDPTFWFQEARLCRMLEDEDVWAAFGCHPHNVRDWSDFAERQLTEICSRYRRVVALGEIGLDYSANNSTDHALQQQVFRRQIALGVSLGLPLVLHVRDAEEDALRIATEMIPREHPIHRHCITGNYPMVCRWMETFPNCHVGFTPIICNPRARDARHAALSVDLNRVVLETDAPYFLPHCYSRGDQSDLPSGQQLRLSHPGLALHVAAQLSHMRRLPLEEVVRVTAANTRWLYRLPEADAPSSDPLPRLEHRECGYLSL